MEPIYLTVALDTPLDRLFDYRWEPVDAEPLPQVGQIALLPFGRQEIAGLIVAISGQTEVPLDKIKAVLSVRHQCPPLALPWIDLCRFAADYYQRPLGEVAIPALPKNLRVPKATSLDRNLKKLAKLATEQSAKPDQEPQLNSQQQDAVNRISASTAFAAFLLHGVTGSGKTEVYLQTAAKVLAYGSEPTIKAEGAATGSS